MLLINIKIRDTKVKQTPVCQTPCISKTKSFLQLFWAINTLQRRLCCQVKNKRNQLLKNVSIGVSLLLPQPMCRSSAELFLSSVWAAIIMMHLECWAEQPSMTTSHFKCVINAFQRQLISKTCTIVRNSIRCKILWHTSNPNSAKR